MTPKPTLNELVLKLGSKCQRCKAKKSVIDSIERMPAFICWVRPDSQRGIGSSSCVVWETGDEGVSHFGILDSSGQLIDSDDCEYFH